MGPRAVLDASAGVTVVASLVWSCWTYAHQAWTRPSATDYQAASAFIRERFEPGDLVDLHPHYATQARQWMGDLPHANFRHPRDEDLSRFRRLWLLCSYSSGNEVGIPGARLLATAAFGSVDVRLLELGEPARILFDFRAELEHATVWIEGEGAKLPCSEWREGRWLCDHTDWNYAGREILEMGGEPREVVWDHPVDGGVKIVEYHDVPLGAAVVGRSGLTPWAVRDGPTPVTFTVSIDGNEVFRRTDGPPDAFAPFRIDTTAWRGSRHTVRWSVSTPASGSRHWAFQADARE